MVLLTSEEVSELTGAKRTSTQQAALRSMGIPFRVGPHRVLVSRSVAESWLAGAEPSPQHGCGVRLDLVK